MSPDPAKIAVIGAGWWSQGWHLPHLHRHEQVHLVAIVDPCEHPQSNLAPLQSLEHLAQEYQVQVFSSVAELLEAIPDLDGVVIATPHATHFEVAQQCLGKVHILLEKPMTTDVDQAYQLQQMVQQQQQQQQQQEEEEADQQSRKEFFINHTANYRHQALAARQAVQNHVGKLRYISISMVSALSWIFDNPANIGWNETTTSSSNNKMLGNGFGWGQVSHVLAWMVYVCPQLVPWRVVSCYMIHSETTSADVAVSATILCKQNDDKDDIVLVSFSGTSLLPGHAHSDPPVGKQLDFRIFGSNGAVLYCGDTETTSSSGISSLQVRRVDSGGQVEYPLQQRILGQEQEDDDDDFGFEFENLDQQGTGPESLQNFVNACQASSSLDSTSRSSSGCYNYHVAADVTVGLKSVQILDAMYRSHCSGKTEDVQYYAHGD